MAVNASFGMQCSTTCCTLFPPWYMGSVESVGLFGSGAGRARLSLFAA